MGLLSKFEGKMEDTVEGTAEKLGAAAISPVQIAKKAEKQMRREKMVGAGKQYAPTLYTVLVSADDDARLFGYYPTLAGETETYLAAKASEQGLAMDGQPLVRFIVDDNLKNGKFEVVAEMVAAPIILQLRQEEMEHYGLSNADGAKGRSYRQASAGAGNGNDYNEAPRNEAPRQMSNDQQNAANQYDDQYDEYADQYNAQSAQGGAAQYDVEQNAADQYAADRYSAQNAAAAAQAPAAAAPAVASAQAPAPAPAAAAPAQASAAADAAMFDQVEDVYLYDITHDAAFTLDGRPAIIGRESKCDIVIHDINVSRSHAEIRLDETGAWLLSDLGSTNGTFVNGRQIKSMPLRDADRITVGTTDLEFQIL